MPHKKKPSGIFSSTPGRKKAPDAAAATPKAKHAAAAHAAARSRSLPPLPLPTHEVDITPNHAEPGESRGAVNGLAGRLRSLVLSLRLRHNSAVASTSNPEQMHGGNGTSKGAALKRLDQDAELSFGSFGARRDPRWSLS